MRLMIATLRRPGDWLGKPSQIREDVAMDLAKKASLSQGYTLKIMPCGIAIMSAVYDFAGHFEIEFLNPVDALCFASLSRPGNDEQQFLTALEASV